MIQNRGYLLVFLTAVISGLLFGGFNFALAHDEAVGVDFFYSPTCPHCAKEKIFLRDLKEKYPEIEINQYDVVNSRESQNILQEFYARYEVPKSLQGLVPATFTPTKYFIGFDDKVAKELDNCLKECLVARSEEH